jgi:mercuric ion transport protein
MTINRENAVAGTQRRQQLTQRLTLAASLFGGLAASSCCIGPLLLFGLGVSGAWIGNLTRLAPYQPYFIIGTFACLGYGYWLIHRATRLACSDDQACTRPLSDRVVKGGLILATVLVLAALAFDLVGPLLLSL